MYNIVVIIEGEKKWKALGTVLIILLVLFASAYLP